MPSDPCLVEVAAPMTESLHSVKIVMGLLGPFLSMEKVIGSSKVATLYQLKYQKRESALLAHGFSYRGISARCLEPDHVSREKILKPHTDEKHPNDLIAIFQCGGTLGAGPLSPNSWNSKRNWTHHLRPRVTKYSNGTRKTTRLRHQHSLTPPWPPLLHHPSFLLQEVQHPTTPLQPQALPAQPRPVRHRQATTTHRPRQRCILRPKGTPMTNNSSLLYSKNTPTTHTAQT